MVVDAGRDILPPEQFGFREGPRYLLPAVEINRGRGGLVFGLGSQPLQ